MGINVHAFETLYYQGRIVRHKGERKVILNARMNNYGSVSITFVDRTKCTDLKDIELDGRK